MDVPAASPWDHHDRERLAAELGVGGVEGQAVVLAAPMGCTVRLRVRASDARSAAWAAIEATRRAGRRLGLPLETVLRHSVLSGRDRSFRRGLPGGPARSADPD